MLPCFRSRFEADVQRPAFLFESISWPFAEVLQASDSSSLLFKIREAHITVGTMVCAFCGSPRQLGLEGQDDPTPFGVPQHS